MNKIKSSLSILIAVSAISLIFSNALFASEEDDEMAAMQRQLNANVMNQPFDPGDVARVDAYIKSAMQKDLKPVSVAPTYWRPGYTCNYIRRYRYRYRAYRDCLYYHRYHGRYWGQPVVVAPAAVVVAPAPVVVAPAPVVVRSEPRVVVKSSSQTIRVEKFDEDALQDYYKGLKSAVKFMSMFSTFTPEQFDQMSKQSNGSQWWMAWSGIVTGQLETAKIELEDWPTSAKKEAWAILGNKITKYNKLFNKHRDSIIANNAFEDKLRNSVKGFDLVTEESLME
ncbi:MAG: hypothetical protein KUG78_02555 [Kangiellaceae bacterium]|nr:hypothetical protein [Kangiellaceae bacterium]